MTKKAVCFSYSFAAVLGLLMLVAAIGPATGQTCDPDVRVNNSSCVDLCLRVSGSCFGGAMNVACIDSFPEATAFLPVGCNFFCTGSTGRCRPNIDAPCNTVADCEISLRCLGGQCTIPPPLSTRPPEPPECVNDSDCGDDRLCLMHECVVGNCRSDFECRTDQACMANSCVARCPVGETWVPNPAGWPPIPLGRCQADVSLIRCCYADDFLISCPWDAQKCPVNFFCATTNVCYDRCGACISEFVPVRPAEIPAPDEWERLTKPLPPSGGKRREKSR